MTTETKKILIVEDDKETAQFLQKGLIREGFEAIVAFSGDKAKPIIKKDKPDLMILDLIMPGIDGWQLLQWMHNQANISMPVIIVSAQDELSQIKQGIVQADTFLVKPVTISEVLRAIRAVFALQKNQDS